MDGTVRLLLPPKCPICGTLTPARRSPFDGKIAAPTGGFRSADAGVEAVVGTMRWPWRLARPSATRRRAHQGGAARNRGAPTLVRSPPLASNSPSRVSGAHGCGPVRCRTCEAMRSVKFSHVVVSLRSVRWFAWLVRRALFGNLPTVSAPRPEASSSRPNLRATASARLASLPTWLKYDRRPG